MLKELVDLTTAPSFRFAFDLSGDAPVTLASFDDPEVLAGNAHALGGFTSAKDGQPRYRTEPGRSLRHVVRVTFDAPGLCDVDTDNDGENREWFRVILTPREGATVRGSLTIEPSLL